MRYLVSGGGGMISGHLVRRLLDEGHEVRTADIKPFGEWWQVHSDADNTRHDMANPSHAARAVVGCDAVIDTAAAMGGIGWIESHLYDCFASIGIQLATVQACINEGVTRYLYCSSACVYPDYLQTRVTMPGALAEDMAYPAAAEPGYGWGKLAGELLATYARLDYGLETRIVRYHNIMGAPGSWCDGREKAPAAICRKVAEAKRAGRHEIEVWGDGTQLRSYLDVSDCVDGTLAVMRSDYPGPLNVGSDRAVTVDELIDLAEKAAGITVDRMYDTSKPQGVAARNASLDLVKAETGWEPKVPLETAVASVYRWIEAQLG